MPTIGGNTTIHPTAVIADNAKIGDNCVIREHVSIGPNVTIGNNCTIHEGAKIGTYGSAIGLNKETASVKFRVMKGGVLIMDNVNIGANSCVHCGTERNTTIKQGAFIGAMCNIGHDAHIGKACKVLNMSCICGWAELGDSSRVNPGSTVTNRCKIGRSALVGIGSLVLKNVPAKIVVYGRPAKPKVSKSKSSIPKPSKSGPPTAGRTKKKSTRRNTKFRRGH